MKKIANFFIALVGILLVLAPVSGAIANTLEVSAGTATVLGIGTIGVLSLLSAPSAIPGIHMNGVSVEIWVNYIIDRLWKDNSWLKKAFSDDDKVLAGKIVHIPQPGAKPSVVKNRNQYPAAAVRRTDTDVVYALDEYTTDPTHIVDADKVELSYDKIDSEYGDHAGTIVETAADDMINKWLKDIPEANIIRTSGVAVPATLDNATGNRKSFTEADLRRVKLAMNKQKVPKTERYVLLTEDMEDQLQASLSVTQNRDYSKALDPVNGVVGRLHGFDIYTRASVAAATAAGVIKALGSANDATDHEVSLAWQKNSVARALGEVKFFENPDRAEYYGDVYSALLRAGGRRRREDNAGVIAIIQEAAA